MGSRQSDRLQEPMWRVIFMITGVLLRGGAARLGQSKWILALGCNRYYMMYVDQRNVVSAAHAEQRLQPVP